MKNWKQEIDRGIELLELCQILQSEKDGVERPALFLIDKSKKLDDFAKDINEAAVKMASMHQLYPLMNDLSRLGRKLEEDGIISVDSGDDYSRAALNHFLSEHSLTPSG